MDGDEEGCLELEGTATLFCFLSFLFSPFFFCCEINEITRSPVNNRIEIISINFGKKKSSNWDIPISELPRVGKNTIFVIFLLYFYPYNN